MGSILDFDVSELNESLNKYGLRKTWVNLLATHISSDKQLSYILKSPELKGAKILETDLLDDLSIGEVSVIYEYSVASLDSKSRKSDGQFFTPDDVAIFMSSFMSKFPEGVWLDPCSGIGNLSWHLVDTQSDPENFLTNNLLLSDKDELALLIARVLLTKSFQDKQKDLFNKIKNNFIVFDFLSVSSNQVMSLIGDNKDLSEIPIHDFVIVNPPYLATKADERFETAKSGDLYAYFLENIIKTSKGFISITPQSFTNAGKFKSLRSLLLNNFSNLTIYNFDNIPGNIFFGIKFGSKNSNTANSIRSAVMVALPGRGKQRITSLMRWKSAERKKLFKSINKYLSNVPLSEQYFPKVSKPFEELYFSLDLSNNLGALICKGKTKYPLHIPASPRYFISALKTEAKRQSQHTLYFENEQQRNIAYLMINSSLMYWWWRVRDGGMTLSQETLRSLPVPDFTVRQAVVKKLEASEVTNKVYKQNAGSPQENVKHPKSLVISVNRIVIPDFADLLITTHDNSDLD
jgi:hypothetical protein